MTGTETGGAGWDPDRYLRHGEMRRRPAMDLLARIEVAEPAEIHDLGTGTGVLARAMASRWPEARIVGSDVSTEMLAAAGAAPAGVEWRHLDVTDWDPGERVDVITANSVLHWVPGHDALLERLVGSVRTGGALAVQMPRSWHEPSHRLLREILDREGLGSESLRRALARDPVAEPERYHRLLSGSASRLDIWTTRYLHRLVGDRPVLDWVTATALRPVLAHLAPPEIERFLPRYRRALDDAYPPETDGSTLFPFPRLFVVAHR